MLQSAVDDMSAVDAVANRFHAAVDLGDHAAFDNAVAFEHWYLADVDDGDQGIVVIDVAEQAADIGHEDQLFRADLRGDLCRRQIGVDVVDVPVIAAGDGGNDRDIAVVHHHFQRFGIDLADLSDKAEVMSGSHLVRP